MVVMNLVYIFIAGIVHFVFGRRVTVRRDDSIEEAYGISDGRMWKRSIQKSLALVPLDQLSHEAVHVDVGVRASPLVWPV